MVDPAIEVAGVCRRNGVLISDRQLGKLREYVGLLLDLNRNVNLISRQDTDNVWFSHILHSLSILFVFRIPNGTSVLDLGTGGGLPGIPLAIARPETRVVLLDSIRKKTAAVEEMVSALHLTNCKVVTSRAESATKDASCAPGFDIVVTRAVARLADLIRWAQPLLVRGRPPLAGGRTSDTSITTPAPGFQFPLLLSLKGGDLDKEIAEAKLKTGKKKITCISLTFGGSTAIGLEDKKLVIVEP